jgi:signal peptidase I
MEFTENETKKSGGAVKEFILEFIKIVIISLAIVIPVRYFLIQPFYVKGASMEPNFYDYEYLIIDEISFRFRQPERGEIIVFHSPYNWHDYFIKRVIALPGERVIINNGEIYIYNNEFPHGNKLDESAYLSADTKTSGEIDLKINNDQYFVLGDNRGASLDSRVFGAIKKDQIVGRAWLRAWPVSRLKEFNNQLYNVQ